MEHSGGQGIRVATWNVEWAARAHRDAITARLASVDADVLVVTEGVTSVLPTGGHHALGDANWGIPGSDPQRRKVLLWSRFPLSDVVTDPGTGMPPGRVVAATCHTPAGPIRVIGVCIPWSFAHVTSGRRDAVPWQEHLQVLHGLRPLIEQHLPSLPLIVMGDFNQRIPRSRAPQHVSDALEELLQPLDVLTSGDIAGLPSGTVDHIAVTPGLHASEVHGISRRDADGAQLSDHDLIAAELVVQT